MKWNEQTESRLMEMKEQGCSVDEIAKELGTTSSSVKHKYTRLQQRANEDSHHHPVEKVQQIRDVLDGRTRLRVLETHAGYGNLTSEYARYARVVIAYETDTGKHEHIEKMGMKNVECIRADSLLATYDLLYRKETFDVVDVDPYGFPSRYFPNVLELINDGVLFVTFPKYGCAQINKITQLHAKTFYDFEGGSNEEFIQKCIAMMQKQAMRTYRELEVLSVIDLQKVYRVAVRVQKKNAFVVCGYDHLTKKGE